MRIFFLGLAVLVVVGAIVGISLYNKPHKDMRETVPDFVLTATELFDQFESDEEASNQKYLDKVIQVTGRIATTSSDEEGHISVTLDGGGLMFGVICKLDPLSEHQGTDFTAGEEITLKGICTGMLMDVVLVRCVQP